MRGYFLDPTTVQLMQPVVSVHPQGYIKTIGRTVQAFFSAQTSLQMETVGSGRESALKPWATLFPSLVEGKLVKCPLFSHWDKYA